MGKIWWIGFAIIWFVIFPVTLVIVIGIILAAIMFGGA
jgi:hypothetical protein